MNNDLISRSALLERLEKVVVTDDTFGMGISLGIDHARGVITEAPTIEAEPVRHGRWIKTDNGIRININTGEPFRAYLHDCSACGWHTGNQGSRFNYCPNCGAKMDGDSHA